MNNPLRARLQRRREAPGLAAMAARPLEGADALVVGCGRDVDVQIALELMRVARVTAVDLDERQVTRARERLTKRWFSQVEVRRPARAWEASKGDDPATVSCPCDTAEESVGQVENPHAADDLSFARNITDCVGVGAHKGDHLRVRVQLLGW